MTRPERDTFVAQWALLAALALTATAGWKAASARLDGPRAPTRQARGRARWFFVLRMPEIKSSHEAGVEEMRARYSDWLRGLRRAGFTPTTLSRARLALAGGGGLPERAVVALFEPGRRRTEQVVAPVFRREGWPAVWLTDTAAMRAGSREYVTFHRAQVMALSGWWDVGYARKDGGYDIVSRDGRFVLGAGGAWSEIDGTFAVNRGEPRARLQTLTVNANWSARELADRLRAEIPVERPACLGKAVIQRREWGVTSAQSASLDACPAFALEAPQGKRGARLYWLGTAGLGDFVLSLRASALVGELQLHLVTDEESAGELTVAFTSRAVVVARRRAGAASRLAVLRRAGPLSARLTLEQGRLTVADDGAAAAWTSAPLDGVSRGLLELSVFEKVRGVARADGLQLHFEPALTPAVAEAAR